MLEYRVSAKRVDSHGSIASTKDAEIILDTDIKGRREAFNPAELFLAAIAACMIKGIERVTPMLKFDLRGVEVRLHGVRQDSPPKMVSVDYELIVDTNETGQRLELQRSQIRYDLEHCGRRNKTRRHYPEEGVISSTLAAAPCSISICKH